MATVTYRQDEITILAVNGKSFVSGLLWKPLRSARKYIAEARDIGKREGMEMVAIRRGKVLQAGFAPKQKGRKKRDSKQANMRSMYSLAAALAGSLGEDWIAAFALGDGNFAFIAVHKGGVLPGRDLVGDQELVEALLRETYSDIKGTNVEPVVIAPNAWGFGGEEKTLETLLTPKSLKPEHRLKPLTLGLTTSEVAAIATLVGLIVVVGVGGAWWWKQQREKEAEQQRLAQQQNQQAAQAAARNNAVAALVRPWQGTPFADDFLSACAAVWNHVELDIGGWTFDNGRCMLGQGGTRSQDVVVATYHRNGSTSVATFEAAAAALGAKASIFDAGETGTVTLRLQVPSSPENIGEKGLPTTDAQLQALVTRIQSVPSGIASYTVQPKPWVKPANQPDAVGPDWTTNTLDIKTTLAPQQLLEGMPSSGMRLYEIAVSIDKSANLQWHLTGEMYGR